MATYIESGSERKMDIIRIPPEILDYMKRKEQEDRPRPEITIPCIAPEPLPTPEKEEEERGETTISIWGDDE